MNRLFSEIARSWISIVGALIVTFSAAIIGTLLLLELIGFDTGPYIGILVYLILPAILALGLVLIPVGIARGRRKGHIERHRLPVVDFNSPRTQALALAVLGLSIVNVMAFTAATYKGVEVLESNEFCGGACHSIMQPEGTAHAQAAHAEVDCVECHVGSGAGWFARAKISGARQVVTTLFGQVPRPIPTPIHNMRPASETCAECHSVEGFTEDRLRVVRKFENDETATALQTVLLMHIGGRKEDVFTGAHWHVNPDIELRYRSDHDRAEIAEIELRQPDGSLTRYTRPAETVTEDGMWREMDCTDCHNRPAHSFEPAESAVDALLASEVLPRAPFIRQESLALLKAEYGSHAEARSEIPARLVAFYRESYPEAPLEPIETGARALAEAYTQNVTVAAGVRISNREIDAISRTAEDELTSHEDTDQLGFFASAAWQPTKRSSVNLELEDSSYDRPFTLSAPTDRLRAKLKGRFTLTNGWAVSGTVTRTDVENTDSGWDSTFDQLTLRVAYSRDRFHGSLGYSAFEVDRSINQVVTTLPGFGGGVVFDFPINYVVDSDFLQAKLRYEGSERWSVGGHARLYDTSGSVDLARDDYGGWVEFGLGAAGYVAHLGYRTIDYSESGFAPDDYTADIAEVSVGYRW